jgi:hypothetical protein
MPHFIEIGNMNKCYVQIPDVVWDGLLDLERKQITNAVEKGFIKNDQSGIGMRMSGVGRSVPALSNHKIARFTYHG